MLKKLTAAVLAALSLATVTITPTAANAWPWRPGWGYWHAGWGWRPGWGYWRPGWAWGWRAYWAPGWAYYYPGCRSYWRWAPYQGRWVRTVTCY